MRSPHSRPRTALLPVPVRVRARGFSMIELLVTIVIASIVFAAMVPFFANALSRTSEDELRVDSTNIAQDRIEQIRLLDYAEVTVPNLTTADTSFGDGRFGPNYTLIGESNPYTVTYEVTPADAGGDVPQKVVTVHVTRGRRLRDHGPHDHPEPGRRRVHLVRRRAYGPHADRVLRQRVLREVARAWSSARADQRDPQRDDDADAVDPVDERRHPGQVDGPHRRAQLHLHRSCATAPRPRTRSPHRPSACGRSGRLKFDTYPGGD